MGKFKTGFVAGLHEQSQQEQARTKYKLPSNVIVKVERNPLKTAVNVIWQVLRLLLLATLAALAAVGLFFVLYLVLMEPGNRTEWVRQTVKEMSEMLVALFPFLA